MGELKVLVIGGGGREHALTRKIEQSPLVSKIYCAPGNAGTASIATNVDINAEDIDTLLKFAKENSIGLTVVGPEGPLSLGIVDSFIDAGLEVFGPSKDAALLEGSKAFMKGILNAANVPTAAYETHTDIDSALAAIERFGDKVVVKADGLAAGKGVVVCNSKEEAKAAVKSMMEDRAFGDAGSTVLIEEMLEGEEASILAFCDGERLLMMPSSQDHKRIGEGDTGLNTGGMGAYSPAPVVTQELAEWVEQNVMKTTLIAMANDGRPYRGILYAGLMITESGPKVLEFNCRFGDPECQPILARMDSDIIPVLQACARGDLSGVEIEWSDKAAVCVVMAAQGYPGSYEKGKVISGITEANAMANVVVVNSGTTLGEKGETLTNGGRVLGVTAAGENVQEAIDLAYGAVSKISWDGAYYRKDIGRKAIAR